MGSVFLTSSLVITESMLEPVLTGITANATAVLPIGATVMGIMLGIRVIPRIFHMFF